METRVDTKADERKERNLLEHWEHQQEYPHQWIHCRAMGAIADVALLLAHFDSGAAAILTAENAKVLGDYVLSIGEDGQRAAWFGVDYSKSGCGEKITNITYRGKKLLKHFAGDRCNPPFSETGWCWNTDPLR